MESLRSRLRSGTVAGAAVGLAGLLAALAVVFSHASSARETADEAVAVQQVEATLGSLATFRAVLGQTLLVAEASPGAAALPVLVGDARILAERLGEQFDDASRILSERGLELGLDPGALLDASAAVLDAIEADDAEAAQAAAVAAADAIETLTVELGGRRDEMVGVIADAGAQAGRVATAARFMVALGMPGIMLLSWAVLAGRRRRRREISVALERERELNRSKDQMIANISHELRTPLTSIYAAARTLDDMSDPDPELSRELNGVVVEQSGELKRMVEDLLVSAQADADRLALAIQEVEVAEAVRSVTDDFARTGTPVEVRCGPGTVAADPLRLRQILRNLVANARVHGGDHIWVEGAVDSRGYLLAVADDGPGVPAELEERLFTRFIHQGDRPLITGSVGLGLSITRLLAEAMGGTIRYSRRDGITRFEIHLNGVPPDPMPPEPVRLEDEAFEPAHHPDDAHFWS